MVTTISGLKLVFFSAHVLQVSQTTVVYTVEMFKLRSCSFTMCINIKNGQSSHYTDLKQDIAYLKSVLSILSKIISSALQPLYSVSLRTNNSVTKTGPGKNTGLPLVSFLPTSSDIRQKPSISQLGGGPKVPLLNSLLEQRHGSISRDSAFDVSNL